MKWVTLPEVVRARKESWFWFCLSEYCNMFCMRIPVELSNFASLMLEIFGSCLIVRKNERCIRDYIEGDTANFYLMTLFLKAPSQQVYAFFFTKARRTLLFLTGTLTWLKRFLSFRLFILAQDMIPFFSLLYTRAWHEFCSFGEDFGENRRIMLFFLLLNFIVR